MNKPGRDDNMPEIQAILSSRPGLYILQLLFRLRESRVSAQVAA